MAEPEKIEDANGEVGAQEPDTPDYADESIEDLEARFRAGEGQVEDDAPPAPEPEPEPVPEPESLPEVAASEEVPPVEEPVTASTDEPDDRDLQFQEMQLEMERMRLDRQHFEHLAGKNATAVDDLRKELIASARTSPAAEVDPIYEDISPSVAPAPRTVPAPETGLAGKVAELQQSQFAQETERVYNSFLGKIESDLSSQGVAVDRIASESESVIEQITPTLKERFEPYGDLNRYPIKTLAKVTRMVLDSAYTDVKLAKIAALRKQASERKATQIAETKIIKQAASPSGSSGRAVQEPPPKTPEQMTADEADAEMIRLFGDHGG